MTDPYAVSSWGVTNQPFDVVTPSGQRCLVRKLEMEDVLAHGLLNKLDAISSILLDDPDEKGSSDSVADNLSAFADPDKMKRLSNVVDKVVTITVLRPVILPVPEQKIVNGEIVDGPREPGKAYIDQIDFMDKMEIFNNVFGGFKGLDNFREGSEAGVGAVANDKVVLTTAELPAGDPA